LAERFLPAREVVVERALRSAALRDDLLQTRRRVTLAPEQAHGGADQVLLVPGGPAHGGPPLAIITIGLYSAGHGRQDADRDPGRNRADHPGRRQGERAV